MSIILADEKFLQQVNVIEKLLFRCFASERNLIAIKSSTNTYAYLTNDANSILRCLNIDSAILNHLIKYVQQFSATYGDNCKIFVFYVSEMVRMVCDRHDTDFSSIVRSTNFSEFFTEMDKVVKKQNFIKRFSVDDIVSGGVNLSVFYDLNYSNETREPLKKILLSLISQYLDDKRDKSVFDRILDDLSFIMFNNTNQYSANKGSFDQLQLLENGFIINRKFNNLDQNLLKQAFNAVILIDDAHDELNENKVKINYQGNTNDFIKAADMFSQKFLQKIEEMRVNLVIVARGLSELKKAQLKARKCSVVAHLDDDYLKFLSAKLNVFFIHSNDKDFIESDEEKFKNYVIKIREIERIDESIYFALLDQNSTISFIYTNVPFEGLFEQIQSYFRKILKVLRIAFQNDISTGEFIDMGSFEVELGEIFKEIANEKSANSIYSKLNKVFVNLSVKLNRRKNENENIYEPLALKLQCFYDSIYFLKSILNLNAILSVKKLKNNKLNL